MLLIIGAILLLNSWSSHVPNYANYSFGEAKTNETLSYSILVAPVGIGNITIGYHQQPGSGVPLPPGMNESVVLPVNVVVKSPANRTLIEEDTVTPCSFQINFNQRGEYTVYLTSKGANESSIPMGLTFSETGGNANREADKYILALTLTTIGIALIIIGLVLKHSKHNA